MSMYKKDWKDLTIGLGFLLPNILGFLMFTLFPLLFSLFMAFTDWNLEMHNMFQDQSVRSVGLANFIKLFKDPDFFTYLGNTLFLMMGIPFGIAGSLGSALLLNNDFRGGKNGRKIFCVILLTLVMTVSCCMLVLSGMGKSAMTILICGLLGSIIISGAAGGPAVYRTLFYFPSFTSGVATYILWKKLYSPENGPINNMLQPILDAITPIAAGLSSKTGPVIIVLLCLMMLIFSIAVGRQIYRWKYGDMGLPGLLIFIFLLYIPMISLQIWSPLPWGGALGMMFITLSVIALITEFCRGREYQCTWDYGLEDSIIFGGPLMTVLFVLMGLGNVIKVLPEYAVSDFGLTAPKWLSDYYWAKPSLMIMGFWGAVGSNNMLLYLAGLSGISQELYESADIDGASAFQRFWYITWPQLSNVTFFILIMSVSNGLQGGFEIARTMTQGGPAGSTTTLSYYIYTQGFGTGHLGYASAVSWVLFAMIFAITLFNWKFGNRYTNE